jgi:hypothetical protein
MTKLRESLTPRSHLRPQQERGVGGLFVLETPSRGSSPPLETAIRELDDRHFWFFSFFSVNIHLLFPETRSAHPRLDSPAPTPSTHAEAELILRLQIRPFPSGKILVSVLCIAIIAIITAWAGTTLFTVTRRLPRCPE